MGRRRNKPSSNKDLPTLTSPSFRFGRGADTKEGAHSLSMLGDIPTGCLGVLIFMGSRLTAVLHTTHSNGLRGMLAV